MTVAKVQNEYIKDLGYEGGLKLDAAAIATVEYCVARILELTGKAKDTTVGQEAE